MPALKNQPTVVSSLTGPSRQGDAGGSTITMRLTSKKAVGRTVVLEGLRDSMLVNELLLLAPMALGVTESAEMVLLSKSRLLRAEDTLAEAGAGAGFEVDVWVGEVGGMPGADDAGGSHDNLASAGAQRLVDLRGKLTQLEEEVQRLAGKIAVKAVPPASTEIKQERFTEIEDDKELIDTLFDEIDQNKGGTISHAELQAALEKHDSQNGLKDILQSLLSADGGGAAGHHEADISREAFHKALEKLPRVRGERVKWAQSLRLEEELARLLPKGDIFDGLKGLRSPTDTELPVLAQKIAAQFASVLPGLIIQKIRELRTAGTQVDVALNHVNSKFSLDGAFVGRFASLEDFYCGPEELIGSPNPKINEGILIEHCRRENRDVKFRTSNYNLETYASLEYEFVVSPKKDSVYPHTPSDRSKWSKGEWSATNPDGWKGEHGRDPIHVDAFLEDAPNADSLLKELPPSVQKLVLSARIVIRKSALSREEVISLRLYTGPMFVLYNAVLRGFPAGDVAKLLGNRYETTIFTITSAITKVSKVSDLPTDRLLFRGLGGMVLPRQFWDTYDECIVTVLIYSLQGEEVSSVLEAVRKMIFKPSRSDQSKAYNVDSEFLQLPVPDDPMLREAVGKGVRVASQPRVASRVVSLELAVGESKFYFKHQLSDGFEETISAACEDRQVKVDRVVDKPHSFRGGGTSIPCPIVFPLWALVFCVCIMMLPAFFRVYVQNLTVSDVKCCK